MDENKENPKVVQTRDETDKKCPECGGTLNFDPATGGLLCAYCGHKEEIVSSGQASELDLLSTEDTASFDWGTEKKTVSCHSCGAELIYDALQVSEVCPYCGSNQVMEAADVHTIAPGGVVPFKITMQQAVEKFKKWLRKKLFCPRAAKKSAKPEALSGMYLPYWTFDAGTSSAYSARYGRDRVVRVGKDKTRIVTDWYSTSGYYDHFFDNELVRGTQRYDEKVMEKIEPFLTDENTLYKPEYLAGFISERYSVGLQEGWEQAKTSLADQLQTLISHEIRVRNRADRVANLRFTTTYSGLTYKYLMLPLWLSSFQYKEKVFQFIVNGQTGKVAGKAPVSALRVVIAVLLAIAAAVGLFFLFRNME